MWASISPSGAAFKIFSKSGAKAPPFPNKGLPDFNCSGAKASIAL
jgi:hypothetical protein